MSEKTTGLTYRALWDLFPEYDKVIREIIGGELFETPTPTFRHQRVVMPILGELALYAREHGGEPFPPHTGVYLDDSNFVEPDVTFIRADHIDKIEKEFIRGAPDLVVEVSSPDTWHRDVVKKRKLYERFHVPEYWIVDTDAERVEVYRFEGDRSGRAIILGRGSVLEPPGLPGFSISVDGLLGAPEEE